MFNVLAVRYPVNPTRLGYWCSSVTQSGRQQGNTGSNLLVGCCQGEWTLTEAASRTQSKKNGSQRHECWTDYGDGCILCLTIENITSKLWKRHNRWGKTRLTVVYTVDSEDIKGAKLGWSEEEEKRKWENEGRGVRGRQWKWPQGSQQQPSTTFTFKLHFPASSDSFRAH